MLTVYLSHQTDPDLAEAIVQNTRRYVTIFSDAISELLPTYKQREVSGGRRRKENQYLSEYTVFFDSWQCTCTQICTCLIIISFCEAMWGCLRTIVLELLHRICHTKTVLLSNIESGWERIEMKSSSSSDGKLGVA